MWLLKANKQICFIARCFLTLHRLGLGNYSIMDGFYDGQLVPKVSSSVNENNQSFNEIISPVNESRACGKNVSIYFQSKSSCSSSTFYSEISKEDQPQSTTLQSIAERILRVEKNLSSQLNQLTFSPPVAFVYNPLDYAWETHSLYVTRYGNTQKKILFVGMNPGPWGMVQTGVPFGATKMVQDWLGVIGNVGQPPNEHPQRRVTGFECTRTEVSGQRFWGFFRDLCITPENLFKNCFVYSYCPLSFMHGSGRNITPPELKSSDRQTLMTLCDAALSEIMSTLGVEYAVGIGKFAEYRIKETIKRSNQSVTVGCMLHPSPINPAANKGWNDSALKSLQEMKILHLVKGNS